MTCSYNANYLPVYYKRCHRPTSSFDFSRLFFVSVSPPPSGGGSFIKGGKERRREMPGSGFEVSPSFLETWRNQEAYFLIKPDGSWKSSCSIRSQKKIAAINMELSDVIPHTGVAPISTRSQAQQHIEPSAKRHPLLLVARAHVTFLVLVLHLLPLSPALIPRHDVLAALAPALRLRLFQGPLGLVVVVALLLLPFHVLTVNL
jgi:hypothetical protein